MIRNQSVHMIKLMVLFVLMILSTEINSQVDCRSILGAHLNGIKDTPLSLGLELSGSAAILNERRIANFHVFAGLDFTRKMHQFYFEGAWKGWYNSGNNPDGEEARTDYPDYNRPETAHLGFRELFYKYGNKPDFLKVGVQTLETPDYFLFNERMLGISGSKRLNKFDFTGSLGTVTNRISRFGDVCGNRHIYNIVHRSQFNFTGDKPGETNFGTIFLNWKRDSAPSPAKNTGEQSDDLNEFEEFEDFGSDIIEGNSNKPVYFKAEQAGIFFYEEFGTGFHEYKYYSGIYAGFQTLFGSMLQLELVDQYIFNDHALAFWLELEKEIFWQNGAVSKMSISYLDKLDIDQNAHFYPAFSNLFMGEVMRLDAIDLPLVAVSAEYQFKSKNKTFIQLNIVRQLKGNHSGELDLQFGRKVSDHFLLTSIFSYMTSELLENEFWMAKLEARYAF